MYDKEFKEKRTRNVYWNWKVELESWDCGGWNWKVSSRTEREWLRENKERKKGKKIKGERLSLCTYFHPSFNETFLSIPRSSVNLSPLRSEGDGRGVREQVQDTPLYNALFVKRLISVYQYFVQSDVIAARRVAKQRPQKVIKLRQTSRKVQLHRDCAPRSSGL